MENTLNDYLRQVYSSIDLEFFAKFIIIYLFVVWLSFVVWVFKDIRNRTSNTLFQLIAFLVSVIPFFGIFIYLIIRPSKTLYEKYYEEIEENLDIINEIIEERKKQFEKKVDNSIEKEKKSISKNFPLKKTKKTEKKLNFKYETIVEKQENKTNEDEKNYKAGKKEIRITQIKKRNF